MLRKPRRNDGDEGKTATLGELPRRLCGYPNWMTAGQSLMRDGLLRKKVVL